MGKGKGMSAEMNGNRPEISADQKIIIFPALTESQTEGQIYFLFSLRQVEDIIKEVRVYPVPFASPHIEGITEWRNRVVPVLSLEKCLGMKNTSEASSGTRLITVRLLREREGRKHPEEERLMFRISPSIRMLSLPIACTPVPVSSCSGIPRPQMLRAVYEWDKGFLAVIHVGEFFSD